MRDESGFTLMELMMSMVIGLVVLTATLGLVRVTTRSQARVANRVLANQHARPVMNRIIDLLHSGCISPGLAPVRSGSTGTSLNFISQSGSAVSPTPEQHIIYLSGTTLMEAIYPTSGGSAPDWTFSSTASSTRTLMPGVTAGAVPIFQYFAYASGQLSTTPLATPLSAANAATTVEVLISFATAPKAAGAPSNDANAPITLTDSVVLRLEPASEDSSELNLPCV